MPIDELDERLFFVCGKRTHDGTILERAIANISPSLANADPTTSRIAIAIADQAAFAAAAIGVLRSGLVLVPLSARKLSKSSLQLSLFHQCFIDSAPDYIVCDLHHTQILGGAGCKTIDAVSMNGVTLQILHCSANASKFENPDSAAVIIYTSGTFDQPKGVVLSGPSLEFSISVNQAIYDWAPGDRFMSALPLTHVAGFINLMSALANNIPVVESPSFAWPSRVVNACVEHRISVASLVPFYLSRLLRTRQLPEMEFLRLLTLTGAALEVEDVRQALNSIPGLRLINTYGLTEAYRSFAMTFCDPAVVLDTIGFPTPGVQFEIREAASLRSDDEVSTGMLWLQGPNVMQEYWQRPDETCDALVDGWINTNDLVQRNSDGMVSIIGRVSDIINAGGEKLHCAHIEQCILEGCSIEQVAVVGHQDKTGFDKIYAIVPASNTRVITLNDIKWACSGRMHSAFWPTEIIVLESLPRTESGKLNRQQLRDILNH